MSFDTRHGYASLIVVLNVVSLLSHEVVINNNGIIIATGYKCFSVSLRKVYEIDSTTSDSAVNKVHSVKLWPCSSDL